MPLMVTVCANELFFQARTFCGNFKKVNKKYTVERSVYHY